MNAMKLAKVCPTCGASWIPIRGAVIQLSGAGEKCQRCGGIANGFFSADHDRDSRPFWHEEGAEHARWRWEPPCYLKTRGVVAWKPRRAVDGGGR